MKRLIIAFITWMLVGVTVTAAWAAGLAKPVIEAEMPDCYSYIGGSGITLFTNASASDGGTLKYQWYVTDIENMAMIRAIDYAEGESYQVPEELGVKWYCYAAWNVAGGAESEPTYSRLIRVEFYENNPVHIHSFGQWMVTTEQPARSLVLRRGNAIAVLPNGLKFLLSDIIGMRERSPGSLLPRPTAKKPIAALSVKQR